MSAKPVKPSNKCQVCGKSAYETERVSVDGVLFHKWCLRCENCHKTITPLNCTALAGHYYCKPCYIKAFKAKGNYDEGFGREQHKKNWAPAVFGAPAHVQAASIGAESPPVAEETIKEKSPAPPSELSTEQHAAEDGAASPTPATKESPLPQRQEEKPKADEEKEEPKEAEEKPKEHEAEEKKEEAEEKPKEAEPEKPKAEEEQAKPAVEQHQEEEEKKAEPEKPKEEEKPKPKPKAVEAPKPKPATAEKKAPEPAEQPPRKPLPDRTGRRSAVLARANPAFLAEEEKRESSRRTLHAPAHAAAAPAAPVVPTLPVKPATGIAARAAAFGGVTSPRSQQSATSPRGPTSPRAPASEAAVSPRSSATSAAAASSTRAAALARFNQMISQSQQPAPVVRAKVDLSALVASDKAKAVAPEVKPEASATEEVPAVTSEKKEEPVKHEEKVVKPAAAEAPVMHERKTFSGARRAQSMRVGGANGNLLKRLAVFEPGLKADAEAEPAPTAEGTAN